MFCQAMVVFLRKLQRCVGLPTVIEMNTEQERLGWESLVGIPLSCFNAPESLVIDLKSLGH